MFGRHSMPPFCVVVEKNIKTGYDMTDKLRTHIIIA